MAKRVIDLVVAALTLIVLSPLFVVIGIWVKLDSDGPLFFRQIRIGRRGAEFKIFKFRSMNTNAETVGGQLTIGADPRVTWAGRFLRRYKLDELPQLFNVVVGQMSLIGPRPEVPKFVAKYPPALRDLVLSVRPGITDLASIIYRDESALLAGSPDPEKTYVEQVMPVKLKYYAHYARTHSICGDCKIAALTVVALLLPTSRGRRSRS